MSPARKLFILSTASFTLTPSSTYLASFVNEYVAVVVAATMIAFAACAMLGSMFAAERDDEYY